MTPLLYPLALFACILAGCGTTAQTKLTEVKIPVAVPCIMTVPIAPLVTDDAALLVLTDRCKQDEDSCHDYVIKLFSDRERLLAYQSRAEAVISGCVASSPSSRF